MRAARSTALLATLLLLTGCASLGLGMDVKPETPRERFAAALVDYGAVLDEVTHMVNDWADAVEAGSPLAPKYVAAAERILKIKNRARDVIEAAVIAMAQGERGESDLDMLVRALKAIVSELRTELLGLLPVRA